ncbi:zeta toxin family protein [Actinomyces howellii]|uniref:UDP-N-acetylglucosamine kinase n=1 Tax=Actinomyces howellii TaxID=52771 RepID=A0A448HFJ4_9ACTO|nr:zeta toxin family protein [Actinomyces howellii]VEG27151.1 Zeta toxin [Actinomyces howellii]
MAPGTDPAGSAQDAAARHYAVLQALRDRAGGDPLRADAPTATINNPRWFSHANGMLVPRHARSRLHQRLAAEITSAGQPAPPGARPVAILLAGPPGSGKSTSIDDVFSRGDRAITGGLTRSEFTVIDADSIKGRLIDVARADGSLEAEIKPAAVRALEAHGEHFHDLDLSSLVHEESSMIARLARSDAIAQRKNILLDQVCSSPTKTADVVSQLDAAGYSVRVVEIHATREFSLESTFGRYVAAAAQDGSARRVPTEVVESVFNPDGSSRPREAIESLVACRPSKVSEYRRYEARVLARPPVLVETGTRTSDGRVVRRRVDAPAPERSTSRPRRTKDEVLAGQRDRARALVDGARRARPAGRHGPAR